MLNMSREQASKQAWQEMPKEKLDLKSLCWKAFDDNYKFDISFQLYSNDFFIDKI